MPRVCTVCHHPEREQIEAAIVAGTSKRDIALQFGVGHMAVQRHMAEHIAEAINHSKEAKEEAHGLDVVAQLKKINQVTLDILKRANDEQKDGMSLLAIDRICKQLELQAKLLGAIDKTEINIMVAPEWHTIRATIIAALLPYPDARVAVAAALAGLEATNARLN